MCRTLFFPIYRSGFSALGIFRARDFRVSQNRVSIENQWKTDGKHGSRIGVTELVHFVLQTALLTFGMARVLWARAAVLTEASESRATATGTVHCCRSYCQSSESEI